VCFNLTHLIFDLSEFLISYILATFYMYHVETV